LPHKKASPSGRQDDGKRERAGQTKCALKGSMRLGMMMERKKATFLRRQMEDTGHFMVNEATQAMGGADHFQNHRCKILRIWRKVRKSRPSKKKVEAPAMGF